MDTKRVGSQVTPQTTLDKTQEAAQAEALKQSLKMPARPDGSGKNDFKVAVSPEAREKAKAHEKALEIARNTSEIREDRVRELKERIRSGQYKIDSGSIADGILREAIRDKLSSMPDE